MRVVLYESGGGWCEWRERDVGKNSIGSGWEIGRREGEGWWL